jgi:pimeloyl-ACP methyl ester carboxylesterase
MPQHEEEIAQSQLSEPGKRASGIERSWSLSSCPYHKTISKRKESIMKLNIFATLLGVIFCTGAVIHAQTTAAVEKVTKPAIVLVHGAFADGSGWSKVISLLQAKGYHVVSVQNPTTSLADDVAATERVINQQTGPVVLVGHSWAGVVITQAGNNSKVTALVYVDASAPDSGQSITDAAAGVPAEPGAGAAIKDENGFLTLPDAAVRRYFAQDLSPAEQGIIAATQTPWAIGCLSDKVTHAAWHDKPSWWVIGENDHMIAPGLQAKMAAKIKAKVTKLPTSHLAMIADPKSVTDVIIAAADTVQSGKSSSGHAPASGPAADDESSGSDPVMPPASQPQAQTSLAPTARDIRGSAPVVLLANEAPVKLIIDPRPRSRASRRPRTTHRISRHAGRDSRQRGQPQKAGQISRRSHHGQTYCRL